MTNTHDVDIVDIIDRSALSSLQKRVLALCLGLAVLDGVDAQLIGFVIPAMSEDWRIEPASFGFALALSTGAMVVGSLLFGPLADRYGRRRIIIVCTVIFSVFTLATAFVTSMGALITLRVIAGLGLGGVTPNLVAMVSEYSPARIRATMVTVTVAGMSLGGFVGGFCAAFLIPRFGWQSLFVLGGLLPLILVAVSMRWLPESVKFLVARGDETKAAAIMGQIASDEEIPATARFVQEQATVSKSSVAALFQGGRSVDTVLLWGVFVINFLVIYFLLSWMPTLFGEGGQSASTALLAASLFNLGGMSGALIFGRITDRIGNGFVVVMAGYTLGAVCTALVAMLLGSGWLLLVSVFFVGFGMSGSSAGIIAIAATVYPVSVRATGVGWAMGIGRIGSIAGPAVGAVLIAAGLGAQSIFLLTIVPTLLAVVTLGVMAIRQRRVPADSGPASASTPQAGVSIG
ncbi:MFS transporter [Rhodococcus pyridinivorans KG-16]|uniref:MFS transporter n=1 Tax=Rhodococcus pyridinivorans KG-16 TaxID=1441730 RepID=A0A0V9UPR4_9NOCA|nr:MFS transporter [Rhodococcus pyridinivorans]KSZ59996.1 MFS transporter [Rhodococcus pyridinivorans KG-16]